MKDNNEIRLDDYGGLDDIVIDCDSFHLERMDNDEWWCGAYQKDKRTSFIIYIEKNKIKVKVQDNQLKTKIK